MGTLPEVNGLRLDEARRRLSAGGVSEVRVRRTGEVGRSRAERRRQRDGLDEAGDRVLRVRTVSGGVELVVGPSFRRAEP